MEIDLELYRREVRTSESPRIRLSAIDIAPDRPLRTLVFVHGFGGQAVQWRHQLTHFALANRVVALDLRGHGHSDRPVGRYSMDEIQADLLKALDILGIRDPCVLLGHSFGGAVVAQFAAEHPERVERLVLIASAGEFRLSPALRFGLNLPLNVLRLAQPFAKSWLHAPFHVLKAWYANNLSQWNGWSLFRDLTMPALVIRGHWDFLFEKPMFEEVARAIPGAEDVDVGTSGHMVMLERRDAVNRALDRFLSGETTRTWRQQAGGGTKQSRATLRQERPWLANYEQSVPYTVAIPQIPVHRLLRSAVRRFPNRVALLAGDQRMTYAQLNKAVNRWANAMLGLGLQPGDRVALMLPNSPEAVIAYFGTLKAGGVVAFAPPEVTPDLLARQQAGIQAHVVVTDERGMGMLTQMPAQVKLAHLVLIGSEPPTTEGRADWRFHNFDALLHAAAESSPEIEVDPTALAVIQSTGGTTGLPKGVMLTHRNLVANTMQIRHWMPEAKEGKEVFLCVLAFAHSYGLTTTLNVPIALGATLILKPAFDLTDLLETIKREQPTIFPGVPAMYMAINSYPGVRKYGIDSIKACISGSAPLPVEVQESFEKLTRGRLVEGYGLTEASPVTHANPLGGLRKVGSIGIPLPSTEACILDLTTGKVVAEAGQIGELAVRGSQVMAGYWRDAAATAEVINPEGWLRTGDMAQMDEEGYFRLIARRVDMWYPDKEMGPPAFPRDIEEVLYEIPQVREAAVVAIANQPIAFIFTGKDSTTSDTVMAYCRRRLPPELVPRMVIFVDAFPRSFIGKILRRELAQRYGSRVE